MKVCLRIDCGKPVSARGLCHNHWTQDWRRRNPERDKQIAKKWRDTHREQERERQKTPKRRYDAAKGRAKYKNKAFSLTYEQYAALIILPCHYCDGKLGMVTTSTGLDRIDNSKGYSIDNVLPCCTSCNRTRGDRFTVDETLKIIQLILKLRSL